MTGSPFVRNVALNLAGQVAPAVAGLVSLPFLARMLPAEELGLLNLGWLVIGYFTLLDFGLGRALTQGVAVETGRGNHARASELTWAGWVLVCAASLVIAGMVLAFSGRIARDVLQVSQEMADTAPIVRLLAISLPVFTLSSVVRAALEAHQRFDLVALVRVPVGVLTYAGPAMMLFWTRSPLDMVGLVVAVRAAGLAGLFAACLVALPSLRRPRGSLNAARALVGQGGWMTMATLAGGVLGYVDRFIVGALVPVAAFTYYATPQEAISRIIVIPVAFSGVVFPKVSADWVGRPDRVRQVVASAVAALTVMMAPAAMAAGVFAPELMRAWLGPAIGPETVGVTRWFLFGIVVNGLATLPFVFLQAVGRARTTGLLQVAELVPFVLALYWAVTSFGIGGAAVVWVARIIIDCALLFAAARRALAPVGGLPTRPVLLLTPVAAGFALGALLDGIAARFAVLALASALTTWAAWHVSGDEARAEFLTRLRRVVSRGATP